MRLDQTRNRWLLAALLGGYLVLAVVHAGWIAAVLPREGALFFSFDFEVKHATG